MIRSLLALAGVALAAALCVGLARYVDSPITASWLYGIGMATLKVAIPAAVVWRLVARKRAAASD